MAKNWGVREPFSKNLVKPVEPATMQPWTMILNWILNSRWALVCGLEYGNFTSAKTTSAYCESHEEVAVMPKDDLISSLHFSRLLFRTSVKMIKRLASYEIWSKSRKFCANFLFSSKIKTTYPRVHPPITSFALRPKLGLWWRKQVLTPILEVLTCLTKLHIAH